MARKSLSPAYPRYRLLLRVFDDVAVELKSARDSSRCHDSAVETALNAETWPRASSRSAFHDEIATGTVAMNDLTELPSDLSYERTVLERLARSPGIRAMRIVLYKTGTTVDGTSFPNAE